MALLSWTEEMSVGIDEIDKQRKELVDLINKFYAGIVEGRTHEIFNGILTELAEYDRHFQQEEGHFKNSSSPEISVHNAQHDKFIAKVKLCQQKLKDGKANVSSEMMAFLQSWFIGHLQREDKRIFQQILNNVVPPVAAATVEKGKHILLVDDDPAMREMLKEFFCSEGLEVSLAKDGRDGIELALDKNPAVIITDLEMPNCNGFSFLDMLVENDDTKKIPIIIVSGKNRDDAICALRGLEYKKLFSKPLDLAPLMKSVKSLL